MNVNINFDTSWVKDIISKSGKYLVGGVLRGTVILGGNYIILEVAKK